LGGAARSKDQNGTHGIVLYVLSKVHLVLVPLHNPCI
jgi:hypothetical protein